MDGVIMKRSYDTYKVQFAGGRREVSMSVYEEAGPGGHPELAGSTTPDHSDTTCGPDVGCAATRRGGGGGLEASAINRRGRVPLRSCRPASQSPTLTSTPPMPGACKAQVEVPSVGKSKGVAPPDAAGALVL
eukprot:1787610-Rhodomonas_salina.3